MEVRILKRETLRNEQAFFCFLISKPKKKEKNSAINVEKIN
jgi:hypothetical protein